MASLLNCAFGFCLEGDPLLSAYVQVVVVSSYALSSDVLSGLIVHWQKTARKQELAPPTYSRTLAQIIAVLTLTTNSVPANNKDSRTCIISSARWLRTFFRIAANSDLKHVTDRYAIVVNALHYFLLTSMNTVGGISVLKACEEVEDDPVNIVLRQVMKESESDFPGLSMALLAEAQKYPALAETSTTQVDNDQGAAMAALQFEQGVVDIQIMPSRAATYVYLYVKVCVFGTNWKLHLLTFQLLTRATIDDSSLFTYLSTRYQVPSLLSITVLDTNVE